MSDETQSTSDTATTAPAFDFDFTNIPDAATSATDAVPVDAATASTATETPATKPKRVRKPKAKAQPAPDATADAANTVVSTVDTTRAGRPRSQETINRDELVMNLLSDGQPRTRDEIGAALEIERSTITYLSLWRLRRANRVVKLSGGGARHMWTTTEHAPAVRAAMQERDAQIAREQEAEKAAKQAAATADATTTSDTKPAKATRKKSAKANTSTEATEATAETPPAELVV